MRGWTLKTLQKNVYQLHRHVDSMVHVVYLHFPPSFACTQFSSLVHRSYEPGRIRL